MVLLSVTVALRFSGIDRLPPGLWFDEARNLFELSGLLEQGRWDPTWLCGQPVYTLPASLTCGLFGLNPTGLRLASALCGSLTVPVVYLFTRTLWSRRTAWWSAWLVAASSWHITASRIGFRTILWPLLLCLAGWAWVRACQAPKAWRWMLMGSILGIGWYTYFAFWIVPVGVAALFPLAAWRLRWSRAQTFQAVSVTLIVFAAFLAYGFLGAGQPLMHARVSEVGVPDLYGVVENSFRVVGMFLLKGDENVRHNVAGWPAWPRVFLPFLVIGWVRAMTAQRAANLVLLALWGVSLSPTLFSADCPNHVRALGNVVPTAILTAMGLVTVAAKWRRRVKPISAGLPFAAVGLALCLGAYGYFGAYAHQPGLRYAFQATEAEIATGIRDQVPSECPIVFQNLYYGKKTVQFILRNRPKVYFVRWEDGQLPPVEILQLSGPALWVIRSEGDMQRVSELKGKPVLQYRLLDPVGEPVAVIVEI